MLKRYTLTDCYALLQVDPKTFRRWLEKASITPQASRADDRVKYLTVEQLEELAELHDRQLPQTIPHEEATVAPGAYKLLVDQLDDVQRQIAQLSPLVQQIQATLPPQIDGLRNLIETTRFSLDTLQVLTDHHLKELQQALEDRQRQQEQEKQELTDLFHRQQTTLSKHQQVLETSIYDLHQTFQTHEAQSASILEQQRRTLQEALAEELQQTFNRQLEQHTVEIRTLLEQEIKDQLTAQMNAVATQLAPLLDSQQHAEQRIQELETMLKEERQAREILAAQMAVRRRSATKRSKPEPERAS